ncbi:SAM-dependent methyltransferase [Streptomyces sp. NPDC020883]|uniref:SAM-dependent methyltransferase n=1 Tax=Streptomyces sp. NPDC020883 TaxID=3365099 RepID=UPI0037A90430
MTSSVLDEAGACCERATTARVDNYLAGGVDNYPADRELAWQLSQTAPWVRGMVRINRHHGHRVVTALATQCGIGHVLDLGCGLPPAVAPLNPPATYISAASVRPDARVAYVDNDPVVSAYARTDLGESEATVAIQADVRQIDQLLAHPKMSLFDRAQPMLVLVHDLLTWVNLESATGIMCALRNWLPAGSAISLTHACTDREPETMKFLARHYAEADIDYYPRSLQQIQALLGPWDHLPPGIVPTAQWDVDGPGAVDPLPIPCDPCSYAAVITTSV